MSIVCFSVIYTPEIESTLWDLIITVESDKQRYDTGENPIIFGKIVDHGETPIVNAQVKIRAGSESYITHTDVQGFFEYEFEDIVRSRGNYVVNIIAEDEQGKIGLGSTTFYIEGQVAIIEVQEKLEDIDFENDPIAAILYKHQQEKASEVLEQKQKAEELAKYQAFLNEKRALAENSLQDAIKEGNPGGDEYYGNWQFDRFVSNLDLSVKDIILRQLNYTNDAWSEAQIAMNQILENGGSWQEARSVYFEKAAISRNVMEKLTLNVTEGTTLVEENSKEHFESFEPSSNFTENNIAEINVNGTTVNVGSAETIIKLNINGTIIELLVNGTTITQIENSK